MTRPRMPTQLQPPPGLLHGLHEQQAHPTFTSNLSSTLASVHTAYPSPSPIPSTCALPALIPATCPLHVQTLNPSQSPCPLNVHTGRHTDSAVPMSRHACANRCTGGSAVESHLSKMMVRLPVTRGLWYCLDPIKMQRVSIKAREQS